MEEGRILEQGVDEGRGPMGRRGRGGGKEVHAVRFIYLAETRNKILGFGNGVI